MKFGELGEVVRLLDQLLQSCGEESVFGRQLRKSRRELVGWQKKGGPVPRGTMLRIVTDVCVAVLGQLMAASVE